MLIQEGNNRAEAVHVKAAHERTVKAQRAQSAALLAEQRAGAAGAERLRRLESRFADLQAEHDIERSRADALADVCKANAEEPERPPIVLECPIDWKVQVP